MAFDPELGDVQAGLPDLLSQDRIQHADGPVLGGHRIREPPIDLRDTVIRIDKLLQRRAALHVGRQLHRTVQQPLQIFRAHEPRAVREIGKRIGVAQPDAGLAEPDRHIERAIRKGLDNLPLSLLAHGPDLFGQPQAAALRIRLPPGEEKQENGGQQDEGFGDRKPHDRAALVAARRAGAGGLQTPAEVFRANIIGHGPRTAKLSCRPKSQLGQRIQLPSKSFWITLSGGERNHAGP